MTGIHDRTPKLAMKKTHIDVRDRAAIGHHGKARLPGPGFDGALESSGGASLPACGAALLLELIVPSAARWAGDACTSLAVAGLAHGATLTLRCAVCALTALRYLAAFACSGSISASARLAQHLS